MVDLEKIKNNICTKKECYSKGQPHRHQRPECKLHPYCLVDPLTADMPIHTRLPQPLPVPLEEGKEIGSLTKSFLRGVEQKRFGETGPQKKGTITMPTEYSLDHYMAQQWNLDVDAMPGALPERWAAVERLFKAYSRRKVGTTQHKPSSKPTLQKKLNQWQKA